MIMVGTQRSLLAGRVEDAESPPSPEPPEGGAPVNN